jgi:hypothetical protein
LKRGAGCCLIKPSLWLNVAIKPSVKFGAFKFDDNSIGLLVSITNEAIDGHPETIAGELVAFRGERFERDDSNAIRSRQGREPSAKWPLKRSINLF